MLIFIKNRYIRIVFLSLMVSMRPVPAVPQNNPDASASAPLLVSMNFQNTDIRQIINFMEDITDKTIIVDDKIKGTITIIADQKVTVEEAIKILNSALKARGFTTVTAGNVMRIIPIEESIHSNVETHIGETSDRVIDDDIVITQVVQLKSVQAATLRSDLKPMVGQTGEILFNESSNTLIITDASSNVKRIMKVVEYLDHDSVIGKEIKIYSLDYATAKDVAALLSMIPKNTDVPLRAIAGGGASEPSGKGGESVRIYGDITVLADDRSNSIIVATSPSNFPAIDLILKKLDSMLSQVLIEVVIMEVSLTQTTKMGMEWYFEKSKVVDGNMITGSTGLALGLNDETFGLKTAILKENGAIDFLNFILKTDDNVNILSTPMIMTSDNKTASISVGQEVPYLKETRRSTGDTLDYVYEYRDVGIGLKVTPHINDQRYVVLDIHQEIKKLGAQTLFNAFIIISRMADASVVVKDRQTVILGGLMRDDTTKGSSKVPFLGDLPLIGQAFRKTSDVSEKTELLVFITPYVVTNAEEMKQVTESHQKIMQKLPQKKQEE